MAFPLGTLAVNATGSFALGLLWALAVERGVIPAELRIPVGVGFLGAYTTFSTYTLEAWRLVEAGDLALAALYVGGSIALGLIAVIGGLALGRVL